MAVNAEEKGIEEWEESLAPPTSTSSVVSSLRHSISLQNIVSNLPQTPV